MSNLNVTITITDYDFCSKIAPIVLDKYPESISYDGGRLYIDGHPQTIMVSHDYSLDIQVAYV